MGRNLRQGVALLSGGMSRRIVLKAAGGAVLLAGAASRGTAAAQEASPAASSGADGSLLGQRAVFRIRTVKAGNDTDDVLARIQEGFVPLVKAFPGLDLYIAAANPETRELFSVGIFANETEVEESNRIAGEWVTANIPDVFEGDATVHDGVIGVATSVPASDLIGKHVVVRLRQPAPDTDVEEVMRLIDKGYVPLVEAIPGFVAYFGSVDTEADTQAYVTMFDDRVGTEESTRVAGEWLTSNHYTFFTGDPTVAEGVIGAAAV